MAGSELTNDDLDGTTCVSAGVDGHEVVAGTRSRVTFQDGRMVANAGCNSMTGPYDVTGGPLAWTTGCKRGRTTVTVDGSTATLSNGRHGLLVDRGPRQG
jgi:heat shock protein HslJ